MNSWQIVSLQRHPQWVDTLAEWHYREWGALMGQRWSLSQARQELSSHAQREHWPMTLIATADENLLGSVSLIVDDADDLRDLGSPWLASLYVEPSARGRGLGSALVRAMMRLATEQGVQQLHLFTPEHASFYRSLGWTDLSAARVSGIDVQVMRWNCDQSALQ